MKTSEIERKANIWAAKQFRKRSRTQWFQENSVVEREWLQNLADAYKEQLANKRLHLFSLASHYDDKEDREIAAYACLLLNENNWLLLQMDDMQRKITANPKEWLKRQDYKMLSLGDSMEERLDGYAQTRNWMIAAVMDELWKVKHHLAAKFDYSELTFNIKEYKKQLLEMVLSTSDGFGVGVRDADPRTIKCPCRPEVSKFIKFWIPDYQPTMTFNEAVKAFDMRYDYDLYYAWLGFEQMMKTSQREKLSRCVRYFGSRYKHGTKLSRCMARKELPDILFV